MPKGKIKGKDPDELVGGVEKSAEKVKTRSKKIQKFAEATEAGLDHIDQFGVKTRFSDVVTPDGRVGPGKEVGTWPAIYGPPSTKRDKIRALKMAAIQQSGNAANTAFGQVMASDEDWGWMLDHDTLRKAMDYDRIFTGMYDIQDPLHLQKMQEIYPEYFEERIQRIKAIAQVQSKLAEIYLTGIKNKEELDLIVNLQMMEVEKDPNTQLPKILSVPVFMLNKEDLITVHPEDPSPTPAVSLQQYFQAGPTIGGWREGFGWRLRGPTSFANVDKLGAARYPWVGTVSGAITGNKRVKAGVPALGLNNLFAP